MELIEGTDIVKMTPEELVQIQMFLAELEYIFGDLVSVPWMKA